MLCCKCVVVVLAMERNNLMRLAHTIPFTPVSIMGKSLANHVKGIVLDVSIILDSPRVWLFLQTVLKFVSWFLSHF